MRGGVALIKKRRCLIVAVASGPRCGYRVCNDSKEQGRQQPSRTKGTFRSFTDAQRSCSALDGRQIRHGESSPTPEKQSYRILYKQECQVSSKEALKPRTFVVPTRPVVLPRMLPFRTTRQIIPVNVSLNRHRSVRFILQRPNTSIM